MRTSDHIIDMGPGAGEHGGRVIAQGPLPQIIACPDSLTGRYLAGCTKIPVPAKRRKVLKTRSLGLVGAAREQPQEPERQDSAGVPGVRDGRQRLRQEHAGGPDAGAGGPPQTLRQPRAGRGTGPPDGHRPDRPRDGDRPEPHRPHAALQRRHLHEGLRPGAPRVCRRRARPRSAGTGRGGSVSTSRAAGARPARARASGRSRCTSCPMCT